MSGVGLALAASLANAAGDPIRKEAGRRVVSGSLYAALRGLVAAPVLTAVLVAWYPDLLASAWACDGSDPTLMGEGACVSLAWAVLLNASLNVAVSVIIQRALQQSDLSLAVPFLSFTPVLLLLSSVLVLVEEVTLVGAIGVFLVSLGGFLLARFGSCAHAPGGAAAGLDAEMACHPHDAHAGSGPAADVAQMLDALQRSTEAATTRMRALLRTVPLGKGARRGAEERHHEPASCCSWRATSLRLGSRGLRGSFLMFLVSILWAVTATLDKIGTRHAPRPEAYALAVQWVHPLLCLLVHLAWERRVGWSDTPARAAAAWDVESGLPDGQPAPQAARADRSWGTRVARLFGASASPPSAPLTSNRAKRPRPHASLTSLPWPLIAANGVQSVVAYVLYVLAVAAVPVSYAIAIKRAGCVFSVVLGRLYFGETSRFWIRLACASVMVIGVALIVTSGS